MKISNPDKDFLKKSVKFTAVFIVIFSLSFVALIFFGLVPAEFSKNSVFSSLGLETAKTLSGFEENKEVPKYIGENPTFISIPKINVSIEVFNPETQNISVLDEFLKKGVLRYPGSGLLGQGNMFLFGHSSHVKTVNPAFMALNGLDKLSAGDIIEVKGESAYYIYSVRNVEKVDASKEYVDFSVNGNMLTLSTCNTLGQKQDRFVVTADFIRKDN